MLAHTSYIYIFLILNFDYRQNTMSDYRKKCSGAANRKRAAEKLQAEQQVLSKTPKLQTFLVKTKKHQILSIFINFIIGYPGCNNTGQNSTGQKYTDQNKIWTNQDTDKITFFFILQNPIQKNPPLTDIIIFKNSKFVIGRF